MQLSRVDEGQRTSRTATVLVLLSGAAMLTAALESPAGAQRFWVLTVALPFVWILGSLASGPLVWGRVTAAPLLVAVASWLVFVAGDLLFREVPLLHHQVAQLLARADAGPLWFTLAVALANAIGEEAFFRGALWTALEGRRPEVWSTVTYVAVTTAGGNLSLDVAAVVMGSIFALQRRASGGMLAPMLTHCAWSALVVLALPR